MDKLLVILLIITVLNFLIEQILDLLNLLYRKQPIPKLINDVYPEERYAIQQNYEVENSKFSFIISTISFVVILIVLYFGILGKLHNYILSFNYGNIVNTLVFFGVVTLVAQLVSLPFSIWKTFVIEEKYGFNKTTPITFFLDLIKSTFLSFIIGGAILAIITWIFYETQQWFWLIALGVIVIFSLLANSLYSRVIVPLFNKQEPLKEGELLDLIKQFGKQANFPVNKVFVIDGSKRSTKSNAYFAGFGRNRRVVLYDTLIEKMTDGEVLAVLAHEIGHYQKKHIWINMGLGILQSAIMLYIFGRLASSIQLPVALGFENATEPIFHLSLVAFVILFSPIEHVLGMFTNVLSRKMEYQADAFATKHNLGQNLVNALKKLSAENLSNLTPHPAYVFVNYSHPTLYQRVKKIFQAY
jgi:STE24 endopeptidase